MKVSSAIVLLISIGYRCDAFTSSDKASTRIRSVTSTRRYNFFKDLVGQAFENDSNLSTDKSKGQYDAPGEEFDYEPQNSLTETQRKWRETQTSDVGVTPALLDGTKWELDLFLSGVPERDPSNDLYGSKVNISSRDKETGLALPSVPSTTVTIELLAGGICSVSESGFTRGEGYDGEWKVSDDGKILRFSLDTVGYTRTVETRGSIQKIYWSNEDEKTVQTSSTYSIPPGLVYGDIEVVQGRQPGVLNLGKNGILRLEQSTGIFGVSSKMVSCGRFEARTAN